MLMPQKGQLTNPENIGTTSAIAEIRELIAWTVFYEKHKCLIVDKPILPQRIMKISNKRIHTTDPMQKHLTQEQQENF